MFSTHSCLSPLYLAMAFPLSAQLNTAAIAINKVSSIRCSKFRSICGARNSDKYCMGVIYTSFSPIYTFAIYSNLYASDLTRSEVS